MEGDGAVGNGHGLGGRGGRGRCGGVVEEEVERVQGVEGGGASGEVGGEAAEEDGAAEAEGEWGRERKGEEDLVGEPVFDGLTEDELRHPRGCVCIRHFLAARDWGFGVRI